MVPRTSRIVPSEEVAAQAENIRISSMKKLLGKIRKLLKLKDSSFDKASAEFNAAYQRSVEAGMLAALMENKDYDVVMEKAMKRCLLRC